MVFAGGLLAFNLGWRYVECFLVQPSTLQKLGFEQELAIWPGVRQLSQSELFRTSLCLSSRRIALKVGHRDSQWVSWHDGHFPGLGDFSWPPFSVDMAKPAALFIGIFPLGFEWLSPETLPKIGWAATLARSSTKEARSSIVISLHFFSDCSTYRNKNTL